MDTFGNECMTGDWVNQFSSSIHLRLPSIMPSNHMVLPVDANWEKGSERKHLSALNSEAKTTIVSSGQNAAASKST